MRLCFGLLLLLITVTSVGQVVWTEPAFPTQGDDIVLYYDASKGNAGLEDYTGNVYAHMGLITNNSNSPTDWKYVIGTWGTEDATVLMNREGPNLYSKEYNIQDFHGVQAGEAIEQLAFVFRSGDGSKAGRAEDGSDIYLEVFPSQDGLLATLNSPDENTIIYQDESLTIDILVNKEANIIITDNGNEIYNNRSDQLSLDLVGETLGSHQVLITVSDAQETIELSRTYFVLEKDDTLLARPADISSYGLSYLDDAYGIALVAPGKKHVFLLCPANGFSVDLDYKMNKDVDGVTFWIELPKTSFVNGENVYQFLVDGEIIIADPYSDLVLDPWNDDGVPDRTLYPAYPEAMTTGLVSAFRTTNDPYDWQVSDFEKPDAEQLVIYEILMRDFLDDKNYTSLLDTLDYLADLGINAIELMPIQEFEGNNSWGYNPSFHGAIDKYYGSQQQLQQVIDKCHQLGIAVILDVVFNHAFSQSPLCQLYWDATNFRPAPDNPWLNVQAKHPFNVGYDFNHESSYTKDWVKEILRRMITDLNVDGFRFDLSKGLTQFNSAGNASLMSRYDQSRIDILTDYADHIWSYDEDIYVILEHFADSNEEKELASKGMMLWSNNTFQFAEAAMGYRSDLSAASYKSRGFSSPAIIAYMESHDEERMGYKIKTWGNAITGYNTKQPWTFSQRIMATAATYLCMPGPKMLWQFGELGYDESINRCEDGSISDNCRLSPKPIRWDHLDVDYRKNTKDRIAALLYLRNNHEVFHTPNFSFRDDDFFKRIKLNGVDMNVSMVANFDVTDMDVSPEFQHTGVWYDYFTGEEITVSDVNMVIDLSAGDFRIYTDKQIVPPGGFFSSSVELAEHATRIFPNPVPAGETMHLYITNADNVSVADGVGRGVPLGMQRQGELVMITTDINMQPGVYYLKIAQGSQLRIMKFVVVK